MFWPGFEEHLAAGLREVTDRVFLTVSARDDSRSYVQFSGDAHAVSAEASGFASAFAAGHSALEAAGWAAPTPGQPNWTSSLPMPALTGEYAGLARRCVVALRDAFGVANPNVLQYRAWRAAEIAPPGATWSREKYGSLDAGQDPLVISALAVPREGEAP